MIKFRLTNIFYQFIEVNVVFEVYDQLQGCLLFIFSNVLETMTSPNPMDRFSFLMEDFNALSGIVSSHGAQLSVLTNQLLITRCQMHEESCGRVNTDNLHHFMLMGVPYLPLGTDIQTRLKQQVGTYLAAMNLRSTDHIVNIRQYKTKVEGIATYDVQMQNRDMAAEIRSTFGSYWKKAPKGQVKKVLPKELNNISLTISHTFASRVRVKILKEMAKLHQAANPDLSVFVTNYLPRPLA